MYWLRIFIMLFLLYDVFFKINLLLIKEYQQIKYTIQKFKKCK